ncbi:MAG: hypothetical protein ABIH20_03885 [Candidatus Diapherotrites archaeon]
MSFHAIDLISPAIEKTKAFFTGPDLRTKWIKIGILVFIFTILSGGGGGSGGNFGSPGDSTEFNEVGPQIQSAIDSITPETWSLIITVAIVGFILLFLLGILLNQIKNITFFAILESLKTNKVLIVPYWKKFWGKAISLTIFNTIIGVLSIPLIFGLLFVVFAGFALLFGIDISVFGPLKSLVTIPALLIIGLIVFIGMIVFSLIGFLLTQFAMYWMHISEMKAFEAFKKSYHLAVKNLMEVVVLIVMKTILGIAIGIISIIGVIIILIPFAIIAIVLGVLLVPFIIASPALLILSILILIIGLLIFALIATIILAPLTIFEFNYNLMFLDKLLGK